MHRSVPGLTIEAVDLTGSTNADLLARRDTLHGPTLLIAEHQSAGRGRAGRSWHSEREQSLTCSLAWPFALPQYALAGLSLAVGVALADTLALFDLEVMLKWPNDVLYRGRKVAGILIETASGAAQPLYAVIGIGINLQPSNQLTQRVDQPIGALGLASQRELVVAGLLDQLGATLQQFERQGFPAFAARWNALHLHAGQQVTLSDQGRVLMQGAAVGVDAQGRLLIDTERGRETVLAGDVSLRLLERT